MSADLSICIHTRNRPKYLRWTLDRLRKDFPNAEIIVSDNASDPSYWFAGVDRWIRHGADIGPFANQRAALEAGSRKYVVGCADDDCLLPGPLYDAMAWMDAHPGVVAYYAPFEMWDEVNQVRIKNAFETGGGTFSIKSRDLLDMLLTSQAMPEIALYRGPIQFGPLTRAFPPFTQLVDMLRRGLVRFGAKPWYRYIAVHPLDAENGRAQLGHEQSLVMWDEYRAGLEMLAHELYGDQPWRVRRGINEQITLYLCGIMRRAADVLEERKQLDEARMVRARLAICRPGD